MSRKRPSDHGSWLPDRGDSEPTPEEQELEFKRDELGRLHDEVVALELQVRDLRNRLEASAHELQLRLGRLYERYDELDLKIQEVLLSRDPESPVLQRRVQEVRARLDRSREAARSAEEIGPLERIILPPEVTALYREAARRMHPDLGRTEEDRALRHTYMVRLNAAREIGEVEAIQDLIATWDAQVGPPESLGIGERLVLVIQAIARHRKTLARLRRELEDLRALPDHALMVRAHPSGTVGDDPLGDMEASLRQRIEVFESRLSDLEGGAAA